MKIPNKHTVFNGARFFLQRGSNEIDFTEGYRTKADVEAAIENHSKMKRLRWRAGYRFKIDGDALEHRIVDRSGELLQGRQLFVSIPACNALFFSITECVR